MFKPTLSNNYPVMVCQPHGERANVWPCFSPEQEGEAVEVDIGRVEDLERMQQTALAVLYYRKRYAATGESLYSRAAQENANALYALIDEISGRA